MFRLWSNKHRTACTVQLTEYGRHAAFHSAVELPLKYQSHHLYTAGRQAGRQAGNVKSLIQQAVIPPCMKVSAQ